MSRESSMRILPRRGKVWQKHLTWDIVLAEIGPKMGQYTEMKLAEVIGGPVQELSSMAKAELDHRAKLES